MVEKVSLKIDQYPGPVPERVAQAGGVLLTLTEDAERMESEMNFMIKYSKDMNGKVATRATVDELKRKAEMTACKLLEEVKVIRAPSAGRHGV